MSEEPSPDELAALRDESDFDAAPTPPDAPAKRLLSPIARPSVVPEMRQLPHSAEAEKGALGSILIDPVRSMEMAIERNVTADWFHFPAHGVIFTTLDEMQREGLAIDLVTLTDALRNRRRLEHVGGAGDITGLFLYLPTAANLGHYLEELQNKYLLRESIRHCTRIATRCYDEQHDAENLVEAMERGAHEIRSSRFNRKAPKSMKGLVVQAIHDIEALYNRKGSIGGISTGFAELDNQTDGLHPEEFVVIAARPSHGKTSLAMNIVEHIALVEKLPVLVFSLEMSAQALSKRALCSLARVNLQKVRDGCLSERDFPALQAAASKISSSPIYIEEGSDMTIQEMRSKARRMVSEKGIRAIFVDSLSVIKSTAKDRYREVAEVSNGLKEMAKELHIPVVVVAHLHRRADTHDRPRMSDLRESGNIEQDADCIWMLVRDELLAEDDETMAEVAGKANIRVAKQREGDMNLSIPLTFLKEFSRFETRAPEPKDEQLGFGVKPATKNWAKRARPNRAFGGD